MQLELTEMKPNSDPNLEYLKLLASTQVNLRDYFIVLETKRNELKIIYQLPDEKIGGNDCLILYTGNGNKPPETNDRKGINYFCFMGISQSIWKDSNSRTAHLFDIKDASAVECK